LLIGGPGSGKGTQALLIQSVVGLTHVASGELLRSHRQLGTELGRRAQAAMDSGALVSDELVTEMVLDRLRDPDNVYGDTARGAMLDGFPRTVTQAQALDHYLAETGGSLRAALYLEVAQATLVSRISGRRTCPSCQSTYHVSFRPPRQAGVCDVCSSALVQRPDDTRAVVQKRIRVYADQTVPMLDYYARRGVLRRIDGDRPIDFVRADLVRAAGSQSQS
jgi:adenylate kinase